MSKLRAAHAQARIFPQMLQCMHQSRTDGERGDKKGQGKYLRWRRLRLVVDCFNSYPSENEAARQKIEIAGASKVGTHFEEMDGWEDGSGGRIRIQIQGRGPSLMTLLVNIHQWFSLMSAVATTQTPEIILSFVFQLMFAGERSNVANQHGG